jgi:histidyl-tRNA synthetase
MMDITIAIDKLDKIGIEKVKEELAGRGITSEQISTIEKYLNINGSNKEKIAAIKILLEKTSTGKAGIEELEYILNTIQKSKGNPDSLRDQSLIIDFTLARGLNYYTGIIFEAKAPAEVKIGSIGGGGRYDNLTGLFGVPDIPGVGISFGVDRIYDVMEEMDLFPKTVEEGTKVLFFNLGEKEAEFAYGILQQLRAKGIASEIYHEALKMVKQFKYAEKKNIPYVVIIGSREVENNNCVLKNIKTSEQLTLNIEELISYRF